MASFDENGKYIKTDWKAGDKITATKLNKIEESIEAVNDNDISRHVEADARLDALEVKAVAHDTELTNVKNAVADNKASTDIYVYDINSRMQFLEDELNEGIAEVNNVASTMDGKINAAQANMAAQVNQAKVDMTTQVNTAKADMEAMVEHLELEIEGELEGLHDTVANYVDIEANGFTLGIHEDGLLYIFKDGSPKGVGIEMIAQEVIAGDVIGFIDDDNNIVLSGALSDGLYNIKYELEDGNVCDIGELNVGGPAFINQIPLSINSDGSPYNNGQGWKTGYRISKSSGSESEFDGHECTGFIKVNSKYSIIRTQNIGINTDPDEGNWVVVGYDENFTKLDTGNGVTIGALISSTDDNGVTTFKDLTNFTHFNSDNIAYIRLCSDKIDETSILTVDEEIK